MALITNKLRRSSRGTTTVYKKAKSGIGDFSLEVKLAADKSPKPLPPVQSQDCLLHACPTPSSAPDGDEEDWRMASCKEPMGR